MEQFSATEIDVSQNWRSGTEFLSAESSCKMASIAALTKEWPKNMVVQVLQLTYGWGLGLNKPCCFPARHLSQVWGVFSVTSLCYAILVPCFLSYFTSLRSNTLSFDPTSSWWVVRSQTYWKRRTWVGTHAWVKDVEYMEGGLISLKIECIGKFYCLILLVIFG